MIELDQDERDLLKTFEAGMLALAAGGCRQDRREARSAGSRMPARALCGVTPPQWALSSSTGVRVVARLSTMLAKVPRAAL